MCEASIYQMPHAQHGMLTVPPWTTTVANKIHKVKVRLKISISQNNLIPPLNRVTTSMELHKRITVAPIKNPAAL
jgi:hypothetical protein